MKQCFVLLFFVSFLSELKAQMPESTLLPSRQAYLIKSKHQRTAACVLAGTGIIGMLAGAATAMEHMSFSFSFYGSSEPKPKDNSGEGLFIAGATVFAAGLGFTIASAINKHKANKANLTTQLKMENAPLFASLGKGALTYPAVAFRVPL